jgi:hypothetical protein
VLLPLSTWTINELAPTLIDTLNSSFSALSVALEVVWSGFQILFDKMQPIFDWVSETALFLIGKIGDAFSAVGQVFEEKSGQIQGAFEKIGEIVMMVWGLIKPVLNWIIDLVGIALDSIDEVVGDILDIFTGIIDFIYNVFKGDWEGAWDAIVGVFKGFVNLLIDGLNILIKGINLINFDVPEWVPLIGGQNWGFNIPLIPRLAQGTVVPPNREFLAVLGDNKKEHEIVSPLSTMKQAFTEAMLEMGGNFGGGNTEVVLEIDGREFGRAVVEQGNRENRRIGTRLVIV